MFTIPNVQEGLTHFVLQSTSQLSKKARSTIIMRITYCCRKPFRKLNNDRIWFRAYKYQDRQSRQTNNQTEKEIFSMQSCGVKYICQHKKNRYAPSLRC